MPPASGGHGGVVANLQDLLSPYARKHGLGRVFGDGVGYQSNMLPRTVRNPNLSFLQAKRLPAEGLGLRGFLKLAPDLAVEVLSPSEGEPDLMEKIDDYLSAGTSLLWVIHPERRAVMTLSLDAPVRVLRRDDILDARKVIPGFQCKVAELFEGIAP